MPVYDYQCDECGHVFEVTKKRSEPNPSECPQCGAADPRRTISATSFQLKGSGWYVTDYKSAATPPPANASATETKSSSTESTEKSTSDSSTSDTKEPAPAPKKDVA